MRNLPHCKEKVEKWQGRRRTYYYRKCKTKFQVDTLKHLPIANKLCPSCNSEFSYPFIDKTTGKTLQVMAHDAELATLRAWKINPQLTFAEEEE